MPSFLGGLVGGFRESAAASRAEAARNAELQADREAKMLEHLTTSDDPEVSNAAASAMLELAVGNKPKKGSFLENLLGDPRAITHPAVEKVMNLVRTPVPGGPGLKVTTGAHLAPAAAKPMTPPPSPRNDGGAGAVVPSASAAMPSSPLGQSGNRTAIQPPPAQDESAFRRWYLQHAATQQLDPDPDNPAHFYDYRAAFRAGATPDQEGHWPSEYKREGHPNLIVNGRDTRTGQPALPVNTGAPVLAGGREVMSPGPPSRPRQLFLPENERLRRASIAKAQGDVEGDYAGMIAAGLTPEEAREELKAKARATSSAAPFQSVMLEVPDGKGGWTQVAGGFNRQTNQYTDTSGKVLPNARARQTTGSASMGTDREAIARAKFGGPFASLTQPQQQQVLAEETSMLQRESSARATGTADANADAPLTTQQRFVATTGLRDEYLKLTANERVRREQLAIMDTALSRADADPGGAAESIRVTFEKILDAESVVREAEYARQTDGLSLGDKLKGLWQKWFEGGGAVPKEILAEFVETARQFEARLRTINQGDIENIRQRALAFKLDPSLIAPGLAPGPMTAPRTPGGATPPPAGMPQSVPTPQLPGVDSLGNEIIPGAPRVGSYVGGPPPVPSGAAAASAKPTWWTPDIENAVSALAPGAALDFELGGVSHRILKGADGTVRVAR